MKIFLITLKIVFRLLAFPFIVGLTVCMLTKELIRMSVLFLVKGGEFIPYSKEISPETIAGAVMKIISSPPTKQ